MPAVKSKSKRKTRIKRKKSVKVNKNNNLTTSLLLGGVVLVSVGFFRQVVYNRALTPVTGASESERVATTAAIPKRMIIGDKVKVNLDEAKLVGKQWGVSPINGTYLMNSSRLGEVGNMIIYGHNRKTIFADLKQVRVGDEIRLIDETGQEWPYRVVKTVVVNPKDTSWLQATDISMLTVYTCAGPFDSQRLIVRAVPMGE